MLRRSRVLTAFWALMISLAVGIAHVPAANAQVVEAAVATGLLIEQTSEKLGVLMDEATSKGDFLMLRAAQEAIYVLDAFKKSNLDVLDVAFDKIGRERQAVLNQVRQTARDLEAGRVDTLAQLEATSDQMDRLVRDATFKKTPTIYRYRGGLVIPGETGDVQLRVSGYKLTTGKPQLFFRGIAYPAAKDANSLSFTLPRRLFSADSEVIHSESATLVLFEKGFLWGLWPDTEVRHDLTFMTLPTRLAKVTVEFNELVQKPAFYDRPPEDVSFNHDGSARKCKHFAYVPSSANRRFDTSPEFTSVTRGNGNRDGSLGQVTIRDVGISFEICARRPIGARGNGYRHADVRIREVWTETEKQPRASSQTLTWLQDVDVKVPAAKDALIVRVEDFTGAKRTVGEAGGNAGRYATVTFDAQSNVVLVQPRVPAELLSL
ncbi:hypothetical protein [Pseudoxanthomonas mexicana]|uniref:hypothetical protein n=1 Tax=Pseudoxanthomonas mexicana TaxID=128785 RepID=UPI0022F38B0E|nr:hypothetical protein [Pseudoxanthomonas mexicana]WBX95225.1 hypothetical protein PE064_08630 [Pseudoxanthomonas mexicana]